MSDVWQYSGQNSKDCVDAYPLPLSFQGEARGKEWGAVELDACEGSLHAASQ